jgi:hypothetical protein
MFRPLISKHTRHCFLTGEIVQDDDGMPAVVLDDSVFLD